MNGLGFRSCIWREWIHLTSYQFCLKSRKPFLDRDSTGSGSSLVSDQQRYFLTIFELPWFDQVATAPCIDPIQVRFLTLRQSPSYRSFKSCPAITSFCISEVPS